MYSLFLMQMILTRRKSKRLKNMPIIKTPAVVLKSDNYRESSKVVTLYTQTHGKLRTIAKGVRNTKTRWGGVLQSMAYIEAMLYFKENRTLHLLSGAEYINSFRRIHDNDRKVELGFRIIELLNKATMENQENKTLFNLITQALKHLDNATKNYVNVLFIYEFKLAKILGFEVDKNAMKVLDKGNINKSIDSKFHNLYNYKHERDDGHGFDNQKVMDKPASNIPGESIFDVLKNGNFEEITRFNILKPSVKALDNFFEKYFEEHFDSINFSKTKRVFNTKETDL